MGGVRQGYSVPLSITPESGCHQQSPDVLSLCPPGGHSTGVGGKAEPPVSPQKLSRCGFVTPGSVPCFLKALFWRLCPPRGSGALDHAHNNRLTNGDSLSILVPWQEEKLTG